MLKTKKSRRAFVNTIFDGTLYIGIGVSVGLLLDSPVIGFMAVLASSMLKRVINVLYDWVEDGEDDVNLKSLYTSGNMNEEDKEYITMVDQEDDGEI